MAYIKHEVVNQETVFDKELFDALENGIAEAVDGVAGVRGEIESDDYITRIFSRAGELGLITSSASEPEPEPVVTTYLVNGFDFENAIIGKSYNAYNGALANSSNRWYSETYVDIKPDTDYHCINFSYNGATANYKNSFAAIWYDEDKTFISGQMSGKINGVAMESDPYTYHSPANARYLRLSCDCRTVNEELVPDTRCNFCEFGYEASSYNNLKTVLTYATD